MDQVELLNGTEYFEVDSDGTMLVKYGVDIDRETMDRITVKARLKVQISSVYIYFKFQLLIFRVICHSIQNHWNYAKLQRPIFSLTILTIIRRNSRSRRTHFTLTFYRTIIPRSACYARWTTTWFAFLFSFDVDE